MISDILSDAVHDIDQWLKDPAIYQGEIRDEIKAVMDAMESLRIKLDTPPSVTNSAKGGQS